MKKSIGFTPPTFLIASGFNLQKSILFVFIFQVILFLGGENLIKAQNIGINTTGNAPTSTYMLEVLTPSTLTSNNSTGIYVSNPAAVTGAGNYGYAFQAIKTGAGLNNVAAYFSASAGTNNYAIIVPSTGGSVGIGTTAPGGKLHVVGQTRISGSSLARLTIEPEGGTNNLWNFDNQAGLLRIFREDYVTSGGGGNGAVRMVIKDDGNVGIGQTAPSSLLNIKGASPIIRMENSAGVSAAGNMLAQLDFTDNYQSTGAEARIQSLRSSIGGSGGFNPADLTFWTMNNGTTLSERVRIDYMGNVGIGTTGPASILSVVGTAVSSTVHSSLGSTQLRMKLTSGDETNSGTLDYRGFDANALSMVGAGTAGTNRLIRMYEFVGINSAPSTTQALNVSGTNATYAALFQNGNVGIGTSTPSQTLDVLGRVTVHPSGTAADNGYNGNIVITKPTASGQYINLIRSGSFPWSIGTVYNTNTFSIGEGQATDANFINTKTFFNITSAGNVGIGSTVPATLLDVNGSLAYREGTALSLVNGTNDNIATGAYSFFRITGPTAAFTITGLAGGVDGRIITLYNTTAQNMTIANNSTSTAANQILTITGGNFTTPIGPNVINLQYNATAGRWLVIGGQNINNASTGSIPGWLVYTTAGF